MPVCEEYSWEKQKNESDKAYAAFTEFLHMEPGHRTVTGVARNLSKSRQLIDGWCQKYNWRSRARDYDNYKVREAKAKEVKDYKAMLTRHTNIAIQMQKKALDALKKMEPEEMSPKDIKEYIKVATELEKMSRTLEGQQDESATETYAREIEYIDDIEEDIYGESGSA